MILFVKLPNISSEKKKWGNLKAPLKDVIEGLRYIKNNRLTASIVLIYGAMQLGAGAIVILTVMFVKDALHGSDTVYGMTISAMAIGSLLGAFTTSFRGKLSEEAIARYSFMGIGLSFVAISFSSKVLLVLLFYGVAGISQTVASIAIVTLLQKHVPNEIMGRTFASMDILIQVCQLVSMGVGSILSDIMGVRMIYILGSAIILLAALGAFKFVSLPESPQVISQAQHETVESPGV
jgi:predicted MFS family arabinose efflux permease